MARGTPLNHDEFTRIYEREVGFVQFIAKRAGALGALSDDVVQETFLRLYQNPPAAMQDQVVRAWLATTARRVLIDLSRKNRHEKASEGVADVETTGKFWFRDEADFDREIELLAVRDLVEEIGATPGGEDFRSFYVEGLKAREIAEQRGEALSTVTTRLSRLRERFRQKLIARLQQVGTKRA